MDSLASERESRPAVGFVTGRLATPLLERVLDRLGPELPFAPRVVTLEIAVAALMTADWVARRIIVPLGVERLVLPGFCRGDPELVARAAGVPVELGPKDLREIPAWLGRPGPPPDYGTYAIEIIAEINHVPDLALESVIGIAEHYRQSGADVIDLGANPGGPFREIATYTRELVLRGFRVSIDSLDPEEIRLATEAGAELVLSVRGENAAVLRDLDPVRTEIVIIPDSPATLGGLEATIEEAVSRGFHYRIDPVLEPIGFGFARSLERYFRARERWPNAAMLMGIGNLTELTDADSAAINLILLAICEELSIRSVLTTEVIHWAETSVRECDIARRLVHHASTQKVLPKHIEPRLHFLRDPLRTEHGGEFLAELAAKIRDRNFRIFAERGELHVMNRDLWVRGTDPFELFEKLGVADASHAFYLGYELAKAVTALTLGKDYRQDEALRWGFLTREETSHVERREPAKEKEKGKEKEKEAERNDAGGEKREAEE